MRKTKKLIGAALSVALCASMLAGCGNKETGNEKGTIRQLARYYIPYK